MNPALPRVLLVRHGQTTWSLSGQHTGLTDLPLTAAGEAEARSLVPRLQTQRFAHVLCSPLQRAWHTCQLAGFGTRAERETRLVEWHYGDYEGRTSAQIHALQPDWQLFRDGCPGGESPQQVAARADSLIETLRGFSGDTLLFSSGHVLRMLAVRWLGLPPRLARCWPSTPPAWASWATNTSCSSRRSGCGTTPAMSPAEAVAGGGFWRMMRALPARRRHR